MMWSFRNAIVCGVLPALLLGVTLPGVVRGQVPDQPIGQYDNVQPGPSGLGGTGISRVASNEFQVTREFESLEMVLGSSRLLTLPFNIPRVVVEDPSIINATPLSRNQVLIRALQAGVTGVGLIDENEHSYTVEVSVVNDVRQLQAIINHTFPTANITVRPLKEAVILVGTVPNPDMAAQVVDVALKFSDEVFQNLQVSGAQNIALNMKVYEVSRGKLRRMGTDWQFGSRKFGAIQSVSDIIDMAATQVDDQGRILATGDTLRANFLNGNTSLFGALHFLEQHDVARLLDEPTLVTLNGRPAEFLSGGEVPILVNAGLGVASIEFRPFGTKVDFLPIVLGEGRLRLDLRYEVSQLAEGLSGDTDTPGFTVSRANVAAEMSAGHSLAIAGVVKQQTQTTKRGLPGLMHAPWIGAVFRSNQEESTELELLVLATPHFIGEVDPTMLPSWGPGQNTQLPSNPEFYGRGYIEVPRCDPVIDQVGYQGYGPATREVRPGVFETPAWNPESKTPPVFGPSAAGPPLRPAGTRSAASQPNPSLRTVQPFGAGPARAR